MCLKPHNPGHRRILLVEDHGDTLAVLARLLRMDGYRVATACCLREALRACQQREFDLLIVDIGLPDGSGHDLMHSLQQRHPVKGIALTGYGMESDIADSRSAGFAAHAIKPVPLAQLRSLILQVLEG